MAAKTVGICSEPFDSNLVFDFDLSSPTNPTTTKDENDMTAKNHKKPPQPAMRENQTSEPTDDQYGPFTEEEFDTLLLAAGKHGATDEEMATFLNWARKTKIKATLLDLILQGDLEISGYKDDGTFVMKLPDSQLQQANPCS
jgi:hypothetical protein